MELATIGEVVIQTNGQAHNLLNLERLGRGGVLVFGNQGADMQ